MAGKDTLDRAVTFGSAVAAPVLTLLVDQHVITALAATDIGAVLAAAVGAYHGGAYAQRRQSNQPPSGGTP